MLEIVCMLQGEEGIEFLRQLDSLFQNGMSQSSCSLNWLSLLQKGPCIRTDTERYRVFRHVCWKCEDDDGQQRDRLTCRSDLRCLVLNPLDCENGPPLDSTATAMNAGYILELSMSHGSCSLFHLPFKPTLHECLMLVLDILTNVVLKPVRQANTTHTPTHTYGCSFFLRRDN